MYGRRAGEARRGFPARQTLEACRALARRHHLDPARTIFAQQSAEAIDAGADDFRVDPDGIEIYTDPTQLETVRAALEREKIAVSSAETAMVPKTTLELDPKDTIAVLRLMERLEELDDVQRVYSNLELSEEALSQYA